MSDAPTTKTRPGLGGILDRVARALGALGVLWFTLVAAWGMFGVPGGGHYAASQATTIAAENMLKWGIIAPVWEYSASAPAPAAYYCHHPFGCQWVQVPFAAIFGHHDWVPYAAPVVMSFFTALLLYKLGKTVWGAIGGLAACAGFVILPITLGFANFGALELPTIFGVTLFLWGHARMLATWKRRYLALSALGVVFAADGDWAGYLACGAVLGFSVLRLVLPKRVFPERLNVLTYARWWIVSAALLALFAGFYMFLFFKWDKLGEFISIGGARGGGAQLTLEQVLAPRKHRIDLMFTPPVILVGKIAVGIVLARVIVKRRDEEFYSLAVLLAATVQYLGFKNGADVHIFWPHYFGLYFALAFAQLAVTIQGASGWVLSKFRAVGLPRARAIGALVALALVVLFSAMILPDAARSVREGRETWGRYNQEGMRPESDEVRVLSMLSARLPEGTYLDAHGSQWWSWHSTWALHGLHRDTFQPPTRMDEGTAPLWLGRASQLAPAQLKQIAHDFHVELYGDMVVVDKRQAAAPLDAFSFAEHEPNLFEWYFLGGNEPVMKLVADPFETWEWRTSLGQPAEEPTAAPGTLDQKRILHNLALAKGDEGRAAAIRAELEAALEPPSADFSDGTRLVGIRRIAGTSPRIEAYFAAGGPIEGDVQWGVRAQMIGKQAWSTIPPDTLDRDVGSLMIERSPLWRKGWLYVVTSTLYRRIGRELYYGGFYTKGGGKAPTVVGRGDNRVDLASYD